MVSPNFIRDTKNCIYKILVYDGAAVTSGNAFAIGKTAVLLTLASFLPENLDDLRGISLVREKHEGSSDSSEQTRLEEIGYAPYGNGESLQIFKDDQLALIDFPLKYSESCLNFGDAFLLQELDPLHLVGLCGSLLLYSKGVLSTKNKCVGLISQGRDLYGYQTTAAGNVEQLGCPVFSVDELVVGVFFYKLTTTIEQPDLAVVLGVEPPLYTTIFQEKANIFLPTIDIIRFLDKSTKTASGPNSLRKCIQEECQSICGAWANKYRCY